MTVDVQVAEGKGLHSRYLDVDYWFCGKGCKLDFDEQPRQFLDPSYQPSMCMRNEALTWLDGLVGSWKWTLTNACSSRAWTSSSTALRRSEWLDDAFLILRSEFVGQGDREWVFGRSDANEQYLVLYHDGRGVSRLFQMTFGDGHGPCRARIPTSTSGSRRP